jgi:hypothetical protein
MTSARQQADEQRDDGAETATDGGEARAVSGDPSSSARATRRRRPFDDRHGRQHA